MSTASVQLPAASMTITITDWVDTQGGTHTGPVLPPGYGTPVWTTDDASHALISGVLAFPNNSLSAQYSLTEQAGTVIITATSTKVGSPSMIGTVQVTIQGAVPDHLELGVSVP